MTRFISYPHEAVRDALRRETQENMKNGLVLYDGQWMNHADYKQAKRRAAARALQHSIEVSVVIIAVALTGVGFFTLINLII